MKSIRDQVQKLVGMPDFLRVMTTALNAMKREIIEACQEVLTAREPYLACITFMGETIEDMPTSLHPLIPRHPLIPEPPVRTRLTSFGAEAFLYPGDEETIQLQNVQRLVGRACYFVSGHPNIVITSMLLNGSYQNANWGGHKFGHMGKTISPGDNITIKLKFRTNSETL